MPAQTTPAQTTNLFLLEDLEDVSRTSELAEGDLDALRSVADWIKTYVVEPHRPRDAHLVRRGGVPCQFPAIANRGANRLARRSRTEQA
jgi:hypothetical protein